MCLETLGYGWRAKGVVKAAPDCLTCGICLGWRRDKNLCSSVTLGCVVYCTRIKEAPVQTRIAEKEECFHYASSTMHN